jgi:hypothetical protein
MISSRVLSFDYEYEHEQEHEETSATFATRWCGSSAQLDAFGWLDGLASVLRGPLEYGGQGEVRA